jgi:hypothetical protein
MVHARVAMQADSHARVAMQADSHACVAMQADSHSTPIYCSALSRSNLTSATFTLRNNNRPPRDNPLPPMNLRFSLDSPRST